MSEQIHPTSVAHNVLKHCASFCARNGHFDGLFDGMAGVDMISQSMGVTLYSVAPGQPVLASVSQGVCNIEIIDEYADNTEVRNFFLDATKAADPQIRWSGASDKQAWLNIAGRAAVFEVENAIVPISRVPGKTSPGTSLKLSLTNDAFNEAAHRN